MNAKEGASSRDKVVTAQSASGECASSEIDRAANKAERDRLVAKMKLWLSHPGNVGLPHDDFVRQIASVSARLHLKDSK